MVKAIYHSMRIKKNNNIIFFHQVKYINHKKPCRGLINKIKFRDKFKHWNRNPSLKTIKIPIQKEIGTRIKINCLIMKTLKAKLKILFSNLSESKILKRKGNGTRLNETLKIYLVIN
jgi:hypothetical protein